MSERNNLPLIDVRDLKQYFNINVGMFKTKPLKAVDGVSFSIKKGETLGLVGESGCGKTTVGRSILHLYKPTSGQIFYNGKEISTPKEIHDFRKKATMVFQDPYSSIDPRKSVIEVIAEYMFIHRIYRSKQETFNHAAQLMDRVGLARRYANSYPHELDGGRRQRIGIARALSLNPKFIVCDEPVSALDVSIQAQILNLLMDLQEQMDLAYMFVTHDLSVVKHISDKIMVMYLGQCVELCDSDELFKHPMHPYTDALLAAIPRPDISMRNKPLKLIKGEVSSPINVKPGCRFASRCEHCTGECMAADPLFREVSPGHYVACVHAEKLHKQ